MAKGLSKSLGWAMLGLGLASSMALAQVVDIERETKVTGPKGKTIERDINIQRGPGYINRQVEIKRPGETIIRDTQVRTSPGGGGGFGGGPRGFGAPGFGGPRFYGGPRFVENVFVRPAPIVGFVGIPSLSFFFGGGGGGGGGGGFGGGPAPGGPPVAGPQPPPVFDAFTDAIGRLKSFHGNSRRDGCLTLGRLGDPRAVPALNERLEHDFDKEVRVAAAWALGEIGDERGAIALQRASVHDHKSEVRDAANLAYKKLPKPGQVVTKTSPGEGVTSQVPPPLPPGSTQGWNEVLDPAPNPNVPLEPPLNDRPPPPPVPATTPRLEPPTNSGSSPNPS